MKEYDKFTPADDSMLTADEENRIDAAARDSRDNCPSDNQNRDIIQEIEEINRQTADAQHQVYKKSIYWRQQASGADFHLQQQIREIAERLARIEEKLDRLGDIPKP